MKQKIALGSMLKPQKFLRQGMGLITQIRSLCSHDDCVDIALDQSARTKSIKMKVHGGRDQIARILSEGSWKSFEPPMPEIFFSLSKRLGGLILDVGANTGYYSLLCASASRDVSVIAFEPDPHVLPILAENISINRLQRKIRVLPVALSDTIGSATLFIPTQEHGSVETSSSLESEFKKTHSETIAVPVSTIDEVLSTNRIDRSVSIIKIDVEGHEAAVLRGANHIVKRDNPLIFIEVLPRADFDSINEFIKMHDYKDLRLQPSGMTAPGDDVSFDPIAWNHLLVPRNRVQSIFN